MLGNEIDQNGPPPTDPSFGAYQGWIKQSFDKSYSRQHGMFIAADFNYKAQTNLEFEGPCARGLVTHADHRADQPSAQEYRSSFHGSP